jgi:hypothetical protein
MLKEERVKWATVSSDSSGEEDPRDVRDIGGGSGNQYPGTNQDENSRSSTNRERGREFPREGNREGV